MHILCRECSQILDFDTTHLIYLLIRGEDGVFTSEPEHEIRIQVCDSHVEIFEKRVTLVGIKEISSSSQYGIAFKITPQTPKMVFCEKRQMMVSNDAGNYNKPKYCSATDFERFFPRCFASVIDEAVSWEEKYRKYSEAVKAHFVLRCTEVQRDIKPHVATPLPVPVPNAMTPVVVQMAVDAMENRTCTLNKRLADKLLDSGDLRPSTDFRSTTRFPGEEWVVKYSFTRDGVSHMGYIGFDQELSLLSVDTRYPVDKRYYRKEGHWIELEIY